MKRRRIGIAVTAVLCVLSLALALSAQTRPTDVAVRRCPSVTVDAGHGGFDGGAVAHDGTQEKDINLQIAMPLAAVLTVCGFSVTMTRTADVGLHASEDGTIREKKTDDMHTRLALYESSQAVVSIHQNMFAAASCRGSQVFYSTNHPCSKVLAQAVREQIVGTLQPDNTRELKTGNKDIFLLYKSTVPTILVECGFLSNAAELERLKTATYQRELALAIACGVMKGGTV